MEVDSFNKKKLNSLDTQLVHMTAEGIYPKGYKLAISENGLIEDTPFLKDLYLKKGARVILKFNVSFHPFISRCVFITTFLILMLASNVVEQ